MTDGTTPGSIVTFYSFKGGVGRTMALANIAVLLAQRGKRVLCVDFDLEAPGLDRYFSSREVRSDYEHAGLLDLLIAVRDGGDDDYTHYLSEADLGSSRLSLLTCGRQDEMYARNLLEFDWRGFFEARGGGAFFESLRNRWLVDFDFVLIDSRTGLTDSGGICTVMLPDILVAVFTSNRQSVDGIRDVVQRAERARQQLSFDRAPLVVFPLPSRFDGRTEFETSRQWLADFDEALGPFFADWLPKQYRPLQVLERIKIPYVPYFSFGENLPVLSHGTTDPEGIGFSFELATILLADRFESIEKILGPAVVSEIRSGGPASNPRPQAPESDGYKYDLYLSYRHERMLLPWIEELVERLNHWVGEALGREVRARSFTSQADGSRQSLEHEDALLGSRCFIPLISPLYFASSWHVAELASFRAREVRVPSGPRIFPMTLKRVERSTLEAAGIQHVWSVDLAPFVSTVSTFWKTEAAIVLDKELERVAHSIADSIRRVPPRDPADRLVDAASLTGGVARGPGP